MLYGHCAGEPGYNADDTAFIEAVLAVKGGHQQLSLTAMALAVQQQQRVFS
jgi:hypothetical protein